MYSGFFFGFLAFVAIMPMYEALLLNTGTCKDGSCGSNFMTCCEPKAGAGAVNAPGVCLINTRAIVTCCSAVGAKCFSGTQCCDYLGICLPEGTFSKTCTSAAKTCTTSTDCDGIADTPQCCSFSFNFDSSIGLCQPSETKCIRLK